MGTRASASEQEARVARMVHEHRRALTRYGLRRLGDHDAVEDLVAETFVVAWRRRADLPPRDEEIFWLYGVARRVLANQRRSTSRSLRLEGRLALERESLESDPRFDVDDIAALIAALGDLDPDDREVLELAYWEGLSYRELGLVLGCSDKAAGMRLSRARAALRQRLTATPDGVVPITDRRRETST